MLRSAQIPVVPDFIARYGGTIEKYKRQEQIYAQGDRADRLYYVSSGKVIVSIITEEGKEALIAVVGPQQLFGEDCLNVEAQRGSSVTAATDCAVVAFRTSEVLRAFKHDPHFTRFFSAFLIERNSHLRASLADQMLLSSEQRLARILLSLASLENKAESELVDIPFSQDMIARMVGTTRSRVNEFMNKFRKLGYIEYRQGQLRVHDSLNSLLKKDDSK